MHPPVAGQLRVERGGQHRPLPNRNDPTRGRTRRRHVGHPGQHFDVRAGLLHPRRTDEDRPHRVPTDAREVEIGLEGRHLPAERVAPHDGVQRLELLLVGPPVQDLSAQQDHPGAGTVGGHAGAQPGAQRIQQIERHQQTAHRGGLAAGQDHRVRSGEFLRPAHQDALQPALGQRTLVFPHITLQREHADHRSILRHRPQGIRDPPSRSLDADCSTEHPNSCSLHPDCGSGQGARNQGLV